METPMIEMVRTPMSSGFALPAGAQHAQRYANQNGQQHAGEQQLESGRGAVEDFLQHRAFGADGSAQVAVQQVAHVNDILDRQRLVQAELFADRGRYPPAGPWDRYTGPRGWMAQPAPART